MKSSQDKLPTSLQATAAATPKATPTKKTATDLQLSTLPAVPGASEPAAKCRTENERILGEPEGGPGPGPGGPGGPGGVGQAKVKIAPELDEVVVVSTSTMESTATSSHARHPPRVQQRKGVNLGFCRNQEVSHTFFFTKPALKWDFSGIQLHRTLLLSARLPWIPRSHLLPHALVGLRWEHLGSWIIWMD